MCGITYPYFDDFHNYDDADGYDNDHFHNPRCVACAGFSSTCPTHLALMPSTRLDFYRGYLESSFADFVKHGLDML